MYFSSLILSVFLFLSAPLRAQTADFDGDGAVAFSGFLSFARAFGSAEATFDLNADGTENFPDFLTFVQLYQEANPSPAPQPEPEPQSAPSLKQVLVVNTPGNTRHILLLVPEGDFSMGADASKDNTGCTICWAM